MSRSERQKGVRGEQEVVRFARTYGFDLKRIPNSGGLDEKGDIKGLTGWHIEVKRQEKANFHAWIKQAEEETPQDCKPVVVFRRSREPWRVIIRLDDFLQMYKDVHGD